ncbi:MAG: class I SAM-dependent methyltransferase [Anaerolineae bacterium]
MYRAELSRIVSEISEQCSELKTLGYFGCLQALDTLEFHVLDFIDQCEMDGEIEAIRRQAFQLHSDLSATAQDIVDSFMREIRERRFDQHYLKQVFNQYAQAGSNPLAGDAPDYDLFDDFLSHLLQIDFHPSETQARASEMLYLQHTPGRIILDLVNGLPLTATDRFYDLGSGLGRVPIFVSLLTGAQTVGIEYEPTYVQYSRSSAAKLGVEQVDFRNLDVRDTDFSDGTIFYLYTPFNGSILRGVLDRLQALAQIRPITICSYGPITTAIERELWLYPVRHEKGNINRLAIFSSVGSKLARNQSPA